MAPAVGGRILVIEDDPDLRSLVRLLLERAGHRVSEAGDGREALRMLFKQPPDLVVLDVGLPGLDGWGVLDRIREVSDLPILMLTAQSTELQKVRALRAGADDYVTKPFGRQELVARVEALLRRAQRSEAPREVYADSLLTIDLAQRTVEVDGNEISLTPLEFRLLVAFVRHASQVLSREQLLELVWRDPLGVSPDQVKLYVGYLRKKLGDAGNAIETVRGFGYRYRPPKTDLAT